MCLYPKLGPNRKYQANQKNGGVIPPIRDPRVLAITFGCGQCMECRKQKAREWQTRLLEDIKTNTTGKFITLTFSTESIRKINAEIPATYKDKKGNEIPLEGYKRDNEIAIYAVRHFLERYRKKYKKSIRHWLVTELGHGQTEHIHLHGIIWLPTLEKWETQMKEITDIWGYGFTWVGYKENGKLRNSVNPRTINYSIKYVHKIDADHRYYKSKILSSAGIGRNYMQSPDWKTNKYNGTKTDEAYKTMTGNKIALPIYWRSKIYTEEERELLWLQKLDKQERWVCGSKVSTAKGLKEYFNLLKYHRGRNAALGYGDDKKNWKREEYENNRRKWQLDRRITTPSAGSNQKGMDYMLTRNARTNHGKAQL